ncbi:BA75_02322T0 [Komagataella pastoris]|uniref:BA75_02322T0 n=1 Tax=Komagataella pastoris TaxID=4922 RepID=A0A1B2JC64_PICPA|nr:BA75_02322T0 [Komagataella pastoris]
MFILPALFFRLALFLTIPADIESIIQDSVLFSTPTNSYKQLQEEFFLQHINHTASTSPLLITILNSIGNDKFLTNLIYSVVDISIAYLLVSTMRRFTKVDSERILKLYLFNPLVLLSLVSKNTTIFNNLFIVAALNALTVSCYCLSAIFIATSAYFTYYSWYLMVPILTYVYKETQCSLNVFKTLLVFVATTVALILLTTQSKKEFLTYYKELLSFTTITPNLGLWWYFFTEIFEFFHNFFIVMFNLYTFVYVIPLTLKFQRRQDFRKGLMFSIWVILALEAIFKPYPVIVDHILVHSYVPLWSVCFHDLKFPLLLSYLANMVLLLMLPIFYFMWINLSSGNANFFYAIGLVFSFIQVTVLMDFIWAMIQNSHRVCYGFSKKRLTQI